MEILWEHEKMSAREIAHILEAEIGWNVNTTYTTIKKLIAKNAVERQNPKFMCTPLITKEEVQKQEIRELSHKLFDNSASALLSAFLANQEISRKEINQIKQLIKQLDEEG